MVQPLAVERDRGQRLFLEALDAFADVVGSLDDFDLLATSRCAGWRVADVVAHVHLGLQEMVLGLVSPTDEPPDTDAASYWTTAPPSTDSSADDLDAVRFVQRLASAYTRPTGVVAHLRITTDGLRRAVDAADADAVAFQGRVLRTGDFLATWVVELAVHQLDLGRELELPAPPAAALALARRTVEALADGDLPAAWPDELAVLIGSGRIELDDARRREAGLVADRLPSLA